MKLFRFSRLIIAGFFFINIFVYSSHCKNLKSSKQYVTSQKYVLAPVSNLDILPFYFSKATSISTSQAVRESKRVLNNFLGNFKNNFYNNKIPRNVSETVKIVSEYIIECRRADEKLANDDAWKIIKYHNWDHFNELIEFVGTIFQSESLPIKENKEKMLELALIAILFHDTGYFNAEKDANVKFGHEERSKEVFESFREGLGISEEEGEYVKLMIQLTKFHFQAQHMDEKNFTAVEIEEIKKGEKITLEAQTNEFGSIPNFARNFYMLKSIREKILAAEKITADQEKILKEYFGLSEDFIEKKMYKNEMFADAIYTAAMVGYADLAGQNENYINQVCGLTLEFKSDLDPGAHATMLEQIGGSNGFLRFFANANRLKYFEEMIKVDELSSDLEKDRIRNRVRMKYIQVLIDNVRYLNADFNDKFGIKPQASYEELMKWIKGEGPFSISLEKLTALEINVPDSFKDSDIAYLIKNGVQEIDFNKLEVDSHYRSIMLAELKSFEHEGNAKRAALNGNYDEAESGFIKAKKTARTARELALKNLGREISEEEFEQSKHMAEGKWGFREEMLNDLIKAVNTVAQLKNEGLTLENSLGGDIQKYFEDKKEVNQFKVGERANQIKNYYLGMDGNLMPFLKEIVGHLDKEHKQHNPGFLNSLNNSNEANAKAA